MVLFKVMTLIIISVKLRYWLCIHSEVHIQITKCLLQLTDCFSISLSFPYVVTHQPAEVFEFEGNVYSHHLSPIARKHSLIAGLCVCMLQMQPQVFTDLGKEGQTS